MKRTIYLPAIERHITLGAYVHAVKYAKANPTREFRTGLTTWWPTTGAEIRRQFYKGLTDRINQHIPYVHRGIQIREGEN